MHLPCSSFHQAPRTVSIEALAWPAFWYGRVVPLVVQVVLANVMTSLSASQARANLFKLMEQAADSHEPIQINGRHRSSVLISEEDWRAMQETLYLLSIRGMRESIRKGLRTPLSKTSKTLKW
jgi:antitoxin YefM